MGRISTNLVNNLCTVWIGKLKLHANVARYQLNSGKNNYQRLNKGTNVSNGGGIKNGGGLNSSANSYANVVKKPTGVKETIDGTPTMVLDESCLNNEEFSLCLLDKVTKFVSLTNLKVVLAKERFGNIKLKYIGGFWVMIVFQEEETMKAFHKNKSVGSWLSQIVQAHKEFLIEGRVIWVKIEGVPCKWWSKNTFNRIASRWGNLLNAKELDEGGYHNNRLCIRTKINMAVVESFKMVYRGKTCWVCAIEVPRWVPDFKDDCDDDDFESNDRTQVTEGPGESVGRCSDLEGESDSEAIPETRFEDEPMEKFDDINSIPHSKPQSKDPFGVYELLNKKKKVTNNEDKEEGEFVVSQNQDRNDMDVDANESTCFGHFKKSTGPRTGGSIIQLIEDLVNVGQTMGYDMTGCMKNMENVIESQGVAGELSEKRTLCDYLCFTICNWDDDVVSMRDFNEVRDSSERFCSVFNKHGVKLFNDLIAKAGLTEVPIGGCIFTWCHKTASKMSKLDRFLVSDSLLCNCPCISSMTLDRELTNCRKNTLKTEISNLDSVLDKGEGIDTDVTRRSDVVRILQDIEKTESMEVAQKAKIKWAVEGDENSKYYHGVINKKRNNLAIRGVLVDGNWVESPQLVKNEFYAHFKQRFEKSNLSEIQFDREFPNKICSEQAVDLEREVSKEEVKRVVWDCGIDKALGPDGFMFGFYRRFWNLIECDVVKAVKWFSLHERILSGGNSSFITLIPKVSNANMVKDFRPISLIGSVVVDAGLFLRIKLDSSMSISNLFYADDAIFMGQWNQSNSDTIVRVLKVFHSALGLRIKMKSKLIGIDVDAPRVEQAIRQISWALCLNGCGDLSLDKNSLWAKVITAIHGDDGKIGKTVNPTFPSIWLNSIQEVAVMKTKGGDVAFKILAPRIYMLESMKDIQVATKLSYIDLEWSFRRKSRGGAEQIQMTILKEILKGCTLSDTKDRWTWSLEGLGEFSVSSIRKTIDAAFCRVTLVLFLRFIQSAHVQDFEVVGFGISGDLFLRRMDRLDANY
nr:nucleotide-binding alpha-beta plait domain-containing protein [Tanacetum cinerariifolium]